jgi:hypothetical protein
VKIQRPPHDPAAREHAGGYRLAGAVSRLAVLSVFACWAQAAPAQDQGAVQPVVDRRLVAGRGLAHNYPEDRGISVHPSVIFADDFETGMLGERWDEANRADEDVLALVDDSAFGAPVGHRSLRVTATLGRNTGGGLTKWFESADVLYIRFYTKFDLQCDYVHHFCTLRANRSLLGGDRWSGFGGAGLLPDGGRRFSTAIEPWGEWGQWPPPGRWNFYSYWHTMHPSPDGKYWGNSVRPAEQPTIERDRWISVELMLRHNTPGLADGEQAFWIDGELRGHWKGYNWRSHPELMANAFTLESYVTDRWTSQPINIVYFDNVVIAREYIGPASP